MARGVSSHGTSADGSRSRALHRAFLAEEAKIVGRSHCEDSFGGLLKTSYGSDEVATEVGLRDALFAFGRAYRLCDSRDDCAIRARNLAGNSTKSLRDPEEVQ